MITQKEWLESSRIPDDHLPDHVFTDDELLFLADAELTAHKEFVKVCQFIGFNALADEIPEIYEHHKRRFHIEGRWNLDFPSKDQFIHPATPNYIR